MIYNLSIDVRVILTLYYDDINNTDMSEEAIPSEMIKICFNTFNLDHMTQKQQALRYFIRKRLKTLYTF